MRRNIRCITLDSTADAALRSLVKRAQGDHRAAYKLGLNTQPAQQRSLTQSEVEHLACVLGRKELVTEAAIMRALPSADPHTATAVTKLMDEYYKTAPRINASRVIEALIFQGAQAIETEHAVSVTEIGHVGQVGNKPVDSAARRADEGSRLHGRRSKIA